jgi:hypothetical protein
MQTISKLLLWAFLCDERVRAQCPEDSDGLLNSLVDGSSEGSSTS